MPEVAAGKDVNPIHKLRIDVQLIQLKGLLLAHKMDEAEADAFMVSLLAICRNISRLDGDEAASGAFEEVSGGINELVNGGRL